MKKILLQFADGDFLVSPETANKVKSVLPKDRYVTTTEVEERAPDLHTRLGVKKQSKSVFERHQPPSQLTPRQQQLAERLSKYLTPSKRSSA